MNSSELLNMWALEVLREQGFTVDEDSYATVSLEMQSDGCCDMCYSTSPVIEIRQGSNYTTVSYF